METDQHLRSAISAKSLLQHRRPQRQLWIIREFRSSSNVPGQIKLLLARSRMKLMFFNLITNALEAMPGGGEVRIGATRNRDYVLVAIEDTGPGIPHEIRDKVFEPFVTARKENGLGLGLAFARQAVLDHGGDMWIEPAAGTRFVIRFPLNLGEGS